MITKAIKLTLVGLMFISSLCGQSNREIGVYIGLSSHGGDANSWGRHGLSMMHHSKLAYGLHYGISLNENLKIKAQFKTTVIEGSDEELIKQKSYGKEHAARGFAYQSNLHELAFLLQYHFIKSSKSEYRRKSFIEKFSVYTFGGFGYALVSDNQDVRHWGQENPARFLDIQLDKEQGSKGGLQIPIGLGISYPINQRFGANLFYSSRVPIHDYLDGISESANPNRNDSYQFCGLEVYINL